MSLNLMDLVQQQLSGDAVEKMAANAGVDASQAQGALSSIIPTLLGGLSRNAASPDGANALFSALDRDHDGSVLNDITGFFSNGGDAQNGDKIVNHILASDKDNVQQGLAASSGLGVSQIAGLMGQVAPFLMGLLGQQKAQQGLDVSGLAGLLGGQQQNVQAAAPAGIMGMITGFLDQNKDGNVMDDAMNMIGGFFNKK